MPTFLNSLKILLLALKEQMIMMRAEGVKSPFKTAKVVKLNKARSIVTNNFFDSLSNNSEADVINRTILRTVILLTEVLQRLNPQLKILVLSLSLLK